MKEWSEVKKDFVPEGSLRDIYIEDVNESTWNLLLSELPGSGYEFSFAHGQKVMALPDSFAEIKQLQKTDPTTLRIAVEKGIWVHCHFFIESEIELDLSPRDIDSEVRFNSLVSFLRWLHLGLRKPVKLTHENSETEVILCLS